MYFTYFNSVKYLILDNTWTMAELNWTMRSAHSLPQLNDLPECPIVLPILQRITTAANGTHFSVKIKARLERYFQLINDRVATLADTATGVNSGVVDPSALETNGHLICEPHSFIMQQRREPLLSPYACFMQQPRNGHSEKRLQDKAGLIGQHQEEEWPCVFIILWSQRPGNGWDMRQMAGRIVTGDCIWDRSLDHWWH